jgi:hypothetical protein
MSRLLWFLLGSAATLVVGTAIACLTEDETDTGKTDEEEIAEDPAAAEEEIDEDGDEDGESVNAV